ncbi:MAG: methyltransferase [Bacteroidales bacterium]|nr:methyltransferase [Bacteroidales bacterium]
MKNNSFEFKQFRIKHYQGVMKVGTDAVLIGAYVETLNAKNILDVGTGTGLIALMLAQKSKANIVAIDILNQACENATENISNSKWKQRIQIIQSALQEYKPEYKFDLIVANPPFYTADTHSPDINRAIARHIIKMKPEDIITFCQNYLSENGNCAVIYPVNIADYFMKIAQQNGFYINAIVNIKANYKSKIIRKIIQFGKNKIVLKESNITIEKETRHDYTSEYIEMTKDYYLNF